jgi:tellurite resistance protein TerC
MHMITHSMAPDWLWLAFLIGILILIFIDIALLHRTAKEESMRSALLNTALWIGVALSFNLWFGLEYGTTAGTEFLTGYVIEKSLSMDNVFVILLLFESMKIPAKYQHRVLFWGVLGAIIFRGIFIIIGAELIHRFSWVLYVFGAILIISAVKFLREEKEEVEEVEHVVIRYLKKIMPVTSKIEGQAFFIREHGRRAATPLFAALLLVETSDIIFAVDSIPAVFAVTRDPFIAFASNILAILGLRSLYFVIAHWVKNLRYLKPGLAVILGYVGIKMLIVEWYHIPAWISLLVIIGVLTTAALTSWYVNRLEERRR